MFNNLLETRRRHVMRLSRDRDIETETTTLVTTTTTTTTTTTMAALWNRAGHYIFALWFLSFFFSFFFPRLISAVGDWMSTILPHTVWP